MTSIVAARLALARWSPALRPLSSSFSTAAEKWEIHTAVCLERLPVVTQPFNDIQKKFKAYLDDVETTTSLKSDHELRCEQDAINAEKLKDDSIPIEELEAMSKITAQDFEDACNEELAQFKFAPIITDADKKNDQKSLSRKLQSHLILLVEQNLGKDKRFLLPQGKHENGLTLRQNAEKILKETCGNDMNVTFFGNAPCGFMKYKWRDQTQNTTGVKLFFYYAKYSSGNVKPDSNYKWLSREELKTAVAKNYHEVISDFLVEERP